jgi:hypothetical protein
MRRILAILIATLVVSGAGVASGAPGKGRRATPPPPFPTIVGVWSHDERNVLIKGCLLYNLTLPTNREV